jgi:DNA segregation ATPase FtsK/SpoIIIE, S-DNA-T family
MPPTYQPQQQPPNDFMVTLFDIFIGGTFRLAWWLVCHPLTLAVMAAIAATAVLVGLDQTTGSVVILAAALGIWRLVHRRSFHRILGRRLRRRWRKVWRYELRWRSVMTWNGLILRHGTESHYPRIQKLRCTDYADRLRVRMLLGQTPETYEQAASALAHAFGARSCQVRRDSPGFVWLEFLYADTLTGTIPALSIAEVPNLDALPIGYLEDGRPWTIGLKGTHVLIAGVTGSGKGSVVWSMIRALGPLVSEGTVELWVIDPKGGMELGAGRPLFARFEAGEFEAMADLLDEAVALMKARARRLAGITRLHEPAPSDPMVVVAIDEVANLTAYLADRKLRERISQSLGVLLTQGRAVGVNVVAALQDPRKEVIGFRNLFPTRVALRLDEPRQVDMVLGDGARDRGAVCDQIPDVQPGVGYVRLDGRAEPFRVRAAWVSDDDILTLARDYPAPTREPLRRAA